MAFPTCQRSGCNRWAVQGPFCVSHSSRKAVKVFDEKIVAWGVSADNLVVATEQAAPAMAAFGQAISGAMAAVGQAMNRLDAQREATKQAVDDARGRVAVTRLQVTAELQRLGVTLECAERMSQGLMGFSYQESARRMEAVAATLTQGLVRDDDPEPEVMIVRKARMIVIEEE